MSYAKCMTYYKAIKPLRAEDQLNLLGVSAYPHMKREKAREYQRKLQETVKHSVLRRGTGKPMSTEELYHQLLRTLGNG